MAIRFNYSESTLAKNLDNMGEQMGAAILCYADTKAGKIEGAMRAKPKDHPWKDQTNRAKVSLTAKVTWPEPDIIRITLAHGVYYGYYLEGLHLEFGEEKKHAMIGPTVDKYAPEIVEEMQYVMSKIKIRK